MPVTYSTVLLQPPRGGGHHSVIYTVRVCPVLFLVGHRATACGNSVKKPTGNLYSLGDGILVGERTISDNKK